MTAIGAGVAVVDYGMGNLRSVAKALEAAGSTPRLVTDRAGLAGDDPIVLPGVGAFGDAMDNLRRAGMVDALVQEIRRGRPFLGICLGMQLLFETSDEKGRHAGLGIFPGGVVRFRERPGLKIPHMGWNQLRIERDCPLLASLAHLPYVYFVHSYHPQPDDRALVLASTDHGGDFPSIVGRGRTLGVQFHPEKSQAVGRTILTNFLALAGEWRP